VTGAIAALEPLASPDSLASLYLLAIFPVALGWGFWTAGIVAVASYLTFDFFFVAPLYSPGISRAGTGAALGVSVVTAYLVSALARRAHDRAFQGELRAQEAALRRVATLVAREAAPEEVFAHVAEEVALLLGAKSGSIDRFEPGGQCTVVGSWGKFRDAFDIGTRWQLDASSVSNAVYRTGRPARVDSYEGGSGSIAARARNAGLHSAVGGPVVVRGRLWGALVVATAGASPLPAQTESRIAQFAELVAAAIANVEARSEVERLAQEQAALRRVATLVAREASPAEVFAKVAEEVGLLLETDAAAVWRYEPDGAATMVGGWGQLGDPMPLGRRMELDGDSVTALVYRTQRSARFDAYQSTSGAVAAYAQSVGLRAAVGAPIFVGGRLWGSIGAASSRLAPIPGNAESRMAEFTELVATAIANVQTRVDAERLAEEQAALRRVATLVAEGASPSAVLDAVAGEMEDLLDADQVALNRFEPGEEILVLAHRGLDVARTPVGSRVSTSGENVTAIVRRTGRPARMENYDSAEGALAELARATGLRSSVSAPITVEGRLWGLITVSWKSRESPRADSEQRMIRFAQLLGTAIANADGRDQLTASRARLLAAGDEARRRVVRDLHDGAQQRLVHTIITLKLAQRALRAGDENLESLVAEALDQAQQGNAELRELAHGILPSTLTEGGMRAGVSSLVARLDLPVKVDVPAQRFPVEIEASVYFVVTEALTNVVKHARATRAEVRISHEDSVLRVQVRDDGVGGADRDGPGLVGMNDRVTALRGQLEIESPAGGGTLVRVTLPVTDA
jgi:signal transduction histidine kinase